MVNQEHGKQCTYFKKLQEKFFVVLKNSRANIENSLVIKCDYGSRKPCFNDPVLIGEKLCRKLRNHDDHVHTKIIPETKSWWNILPSQQTTPILLKLLHKHLHQLATKTKCNL